MKYLIVLLAVLVTACASTTTTTQLATSNNNNPSQEIHVTGVGVTVDEAKQNGFKNAIEYVVGTVLVSEKVALNNQLVKDKIVNYSAGYIDSYKILSTTQVDKNIALSMNVVVKSSHIAEMILGERNSMNLDGEQIVSKYESLLNLRTQQEKLLKTVLDNYYDQAWTRTINKVEYKYDDKRQLILIIKSERTSNQNYYKALDETLKLLADNDTSSPYKIALRINPNHNFIWPTIHTYYFNDEKIYNMIARFNSGIVVTKFLDSNNKTLYTKCYVSVYHITSGDIEREEVVDQIVLKPNSPEYNYLRYFDHLEKTVMKLDDVYKDKKLCPL
jgi:hypothetical protein